MFSRFKLAPPSGVVEPLDVVKDICSGLGPSPVFAPIDPVPFQQSEEALHGRIVRKAAITALSSRNPLVKRLSSQTPLLKAGADQCDPEDHSEQNGGARTSQNDQQYAKYDAHP